MTELSHVDQGGAARMVDISAKADTAREAVAEGRIAMSADALTAIRDNALKKGDAIAVARVAGIMAAKRTSDLIPLCHPLALTSAELAFAFEPDAIRATATARTTGPTGVEMEALAATSVALLTLYDMAKAIDRAMVIGDVRLVSKTGGRSGSQSI